MLIAKQYRPMNEEPEYYRIKEACEEFDIQMDRMRLWIREGTLPTEKRGKFLYCRKDYVRAIMRPRCAFCRQEFHRKSLRQIWRGPSCRSKAHRMHHYGE